jgi:hypothetical protein
LRAALDVEVIACEAVFMIASVPTVQAEAFALLRRPQIPTDLIPEERWEQYYTGFLQRAGLNPALARRAETPLGNVWVIPGAGWICLSLAGSADRASFDGGGLTANSAESAVTRGLTSWTGSRSGQGQMVQGLVPDRTAEVALIAADGSVTKPRISDNVYGVDLKCALARVCFDGETIVSLGVPASYSR